ncbi:TetR/AcrR family transcriptional regulator [Paenibacillus terreus]|uniref:TetR/AcrR family transcriptional regulator n=1 Tax=Paenibacillus terreus TaxID=1387834 RepID=A0ABV5BE85_9BACL
MPYPEGHKQKVRGQIIESAAKAFRKNGIREISVPVIMKGAGLTHGGFYAHFENKEQLVSEACCYAVTEGIALMGKLADREKEKPRIHTVIDYYLSPYHRDHPEIGCILPALSSEISRSSEEVRQIFTRELERMIHFISDLAGIDKSTGSALLSTMVGTLMLARSVNDPGLSESLLASGRQHAKELIKA